ncbi:hypothetical protein PTKIN_Ptkin16aG0020800 [Pterospermum kingtungense]
MEIPKRVKLQSTSKEEDEAYLKSLPMGVRFKPLDAELIVYYLKRKVNKKPLPPNRILEVQLYNYDPDTLTEINKNVSSDGVVNRWYFFTPRDRKYAKGLRPDRSAGNGYWKATGADKPIIHKGELVGLKKTLVFYKGKQPKGDKSNWIMHEYVLSDTPARERTSHADMRLNDWVLCRIYKKPPTRAPQRQEEKAGVAMVSVHATQTQQDCGILPPPQFDQQFQFEYFPTLRQQTYPMPFHNNAYDPSTSYGNSTSGGLPYFPENYAYGSSTSGGLTPPHFAEDVYGSSTSGGLPPSHFSDNSNGISRSDELPPLPESFGDSMVEPTPSGHENFITEAIPLSTIPPRQGKRRILDDFEFSANE